jgi:hypothetical protein
MPNTLAVVLATERDGARRGARGGATRRALDVIDVGYQGIALAHDDARGRVATVDANAIGRLGASGGDEDATSECC